MFKMQRGRPKHSSYRTYQLLYARLVKGALWLDDWASTGLKSRNTVYKGLKYLKELGLVKTRREGRKILYELVPWQIEKAIVHEGILWHILLCPPLSRKERRQIRKENKETLKKFAEGYLVELTGEPLAALTFDEVLDKIVESPKSKEIIAALKEAGIDWEQILLKQPFLIFKFLRRLFYPHLNERLCLDCLRKGKLLYLVEDQNTGEVICPAEGEVKKIEPFEVIKPAKV